MSIAANITATSGVIASSNPDAYLNGQFSRCGELMSEGCDVLCKFMILFTDLVNVKHDQINIRVDRVKTSKVVANQVNSIISDLVQTDDKQDLSPALLQYLRAHHITISVQNYGRNLSCDIDSYLKSIDHPDGKGLNKNQLNMIKLALESDVSRSAHCVTQDHLQLQKTMQSYNVCISHITRLQTLLAEMNNVTTPRKSVKE